MWGIVALVVCGIASRDGVNSCVRFGDLYDGNWCFMGVNSQRGTAAMSGILAKALTRETYGCVVGRTPQINDIELVMAFFSKKCAALNAPKTIIRSGCTTKDEYYDYQGAFKGVIEGACDVGFMKFTIPAEYALDGIKAQNWTELERPTSKALLCSSGPAVRGDLSSFATCNFGSLAGNLSRKISLECLQPHNRTSARRIQIMGWQANGGLWLVVRGAGLYVSEGTG